MQYRLKEAIDAFSQKKAEIVKLVKFAQDEFASAAKEFFDKNDWLESFSWEQYTDYFSDGDGCEFGARADTDELSVNGKAPGGQDWYCYGDGTKAEVSNKLDRQKIKTSEEISAFIDSVGNDLLLEMFGDHKIITVTKEGVNISDHKEHY